jgi:hypothetical protein
MKSYLSYFNNQSGADAADLAAAQAGYSNGRNQRFLNALDPDTSPTGREKKNSDSITDIILTQQPYDEIVARTMGNVRDAEDAVGRVLELATKRLAESQAALDALEDKAAALEDGRKVALDQDGNVRALDTGIVIDPQDAASIEWKGNEPTYEDIETARERADADFEILNNARRDEARLGEIREEIGTKPPADRIRELGEEAEAIKDRNEQLVTGFDSDHSFASDVRQEQSFANVSIPSI